MKGTTFLLNTSISLVRIPEEPREYHDDIKVSSKMTKNTKECPKIYTAVKRNSHVSLKNLGNLSNQMIPRRSSWDFENWNFNNKKFETIKVSIRRDLFFFVKMINVSQVQRSGRTEIHKRFFLDASERCKWWQSGQPWTTLILKPFIFLYIFTTMLLRFFELLFHVEKRNLSLILGHAGTLLKKNFFFCYATLIVIPKCRSYEQCSVCLTRTKNAARPQKTSIV